MAGDEYTADGGARPPTGSFGRTTVGEPVATGVTSARCSGRSQVTLSSSPGLLSAGGHLVTSACQFAETQRRLIVVGARSLRSQFMTVRRAGLMTRQPRSAMCAACWSVEARFLSHRTAYAGFRCRRRPSEAGGTTWTSHLDVRSVSLTSIDY